MPIQPWRGPGPGRPSPPLPPGEMPAWRGGRPLKAWTYVGAFGPDIMLCAARGRVGPVRGAWWAVWDRARGRMVARTARGRGGVTVDSRRLRVAGGRVRLDLALSDGAPIEVISPHGRQYAWTRKRGGAAARGWLEVDGARHELDLAAIVDESAGYHARHTAWRWSAGVGVASSGAPVAWNLVAGIHDAVEASERTVWVAGRPFEVGPVTFADDLSSVGGLRFTPEAVRSRRENLLLLRSDYEQPFGAFTGTLPVAGPLREAWGVMERHDVHW
jgi:Protein of unknown function (DUF2804)